MIFRHIKMTGFKSFAEPTAVEIERGLTGIVGPNGCGKSNVVEALRWVMGESNARQMRGTELDDIDALRRDEAVMIPPQTDFTMVGGLSAESRDILAKYQPETIGQANRLPGLTPAAVVSVLRHVKRQQMAVKAVVKP